VSIRPFINRHEVFWFILIGIGLTMFFAMAIWLNWGAR
jgi:hypothetical protein